MADDGALEGTVVVAKVQTAGRGRGGRAWLSPSGGLYMSVVLRPPAHPQPQLLSLVGALSVVKGIKSSTGIDSTIRWPNDVLVGRRKVSGVIVEASFSAQRLSFAVLGIGLNCNSKTPIVGLPTVNATSLMEELHERVDLARIRQGILDSLQSVYTSWLEGMDIVEEMESFMGTLGRRVLVKTTSGVEFTGTALGLDDSGALVMKSEGRRMSFQAEDVERLTEVGESDVPIASSRYGGSDG